MTFMRLTACTKATAPLTAITLMVIGGCSMDPDFDGSLESFLLSQPDRFATITENPEKHRVQIIYTQIDRDENNHPSFTSYTYRLNEDEYFYPASTVKLPAAALALEKINALDLDGLTDFHLGEVAFGQGVIDKNRIQRLQRRNGCAGRQVFAEIDLDDTKLAAERCTYHLLVDQRTFGSNRGRRAVHLRPRLVILGLRHRAVLEQLARTFELQLGQRLLCDQALQLGSVDAVVEMKDGIAGLDVLPGLRQDLSDLTGHLGGDGHTLGRFDAADGVQIRLPGFHPHLGRGDGGRRWRLRHHGGHFLPAEILPAENAAEHRGEEQENQ